MEIYQLTNTTACQMMGYAVKSDDNKLVVIDGGQYGQSEELYRIIKKLGGCVEMWFLTHPHSDHFGAIIELFEKYDDIKVKGLWRNSFPANWDKLPEEDMDELTQWQKFESEHQNLMHEIIRGDAFEVGNMKITVIEQSRPYITVNTCNNQSAVLKIEDESFSFLILGDLGIEGGRLLLEKDADKIKADGVQMAHHGQAGTEKSLYESISAEYAFWPTPRWLWDNTEYLGGTPGNGNFQTPEVISWMKELGAKNIVSFENTVMFDTHLKKSFFV